MASSSVSSRYPPERPVFVAEHGFRRALIRTTIVVGATLLAAWLAALVAGAIGWGNLPGVLFLGGSDPSNSGASVGRSDPARGQAPAQRLGASSLVGRLAGPAPGGAIPSTRAGSSPTAPRALRSPRGASSIPTRPGGSSVGRPRQGSGLGSGGSALVAPSASSGSGAGAGTGSPKSAGSTEVLQSKGATTSGSGVGGASSSGSSAPTGTLPHEIGQPAETPSGNIPAQDAHGGNPSALSYGKGGNPEH
jgi:hypothetical protein